MPGERMIYVENNDVRIGFAAGTGRLASLVSKPREREYLTNSQASVPFAVWHGFREPYRFGSRTEGGACDEPPDPTTICNGCMVSGALAEVSAEAGRTVLTYRDQATGLLARVTVELDGRESRWTLAVANNGPDPIELMADFPRWEGINLSRGAGGRMVAMNQAGYVGSIWHHRGGLYGNAFQQSAQFGCLYERTTGDCLGFYVDDPEFRAKEILFVEPDIVVRWFPPVGLAPGASVVYPSTVLMLYDGSWHETAQAYGEWYRTTVRPDPVPEWVRSADSYSGAWMEKRGDEYETRPGPTGPEMPPATMDTFDELPIHYQRIPAQTIEFAFYCRQSQVPALGNDGSPLGPQPRRHTDGWNEIREDLGGAAALARGVEAVHRTGRRVTLYVEGLIVPDDSELFEHVPSARDWVVLNADGTTNGPYTKQRFVHMCPGCVGWQDHLAAMCERLVDETGVDGIRLDSLGFYFWPCHNPAHEHASPFEYNRWVQDLYATVAAAIRRRNSEALLSTEAPVDLNHRHFNHALHQIFRMELPQALYEAAGPMRVALPAYRLHTGAAGAGPSLQVQPFWSVPGADESPWLAVLAAVGRTINDGQIRSDPCAPPDGVVCRHVAGDGEDVVIGVRPGDIDDESHRLRVSPDQRPTEVTISLAYRPADAWLYDLERGAIHPLEWTHADGLLSVRVDSCWFVAVFRRRSGPVPTWIDMPGVVRSGTPATLDISVIGHTAPVSATLRVPGLPGVPRREVSVPGSCRLGIPDDAIPGWYRAELAGPGICESVRLFRVSGAEA